MESSIQEIIYSLERNLVTIPSLLEGCDQKEAHFKESQEKWSLLEVICHLRDEEKEDFRIRTKSVLEDPSKQLPPFDPLNWVSERNYSDQDFGLVIQEWKDARKESIQWLKSLNNPKWDNIYLHPKLGEMSAHYFLKNWLAHDFLHMRQIIRIKYSYLKSRSEDNLNYAGNW